MMEKLGKLLDELTLLASEARVYLARHKNGTELPLKDAPAPAAAEPAPAVEKAPRKKREPKAPATVEDAAAAPAEKPVPSPEPAMTEEQSYQKMTEVVTAFIRRSATKDDGVTTVRKILNEVYKVGKLTDLVHAQRIQIIVDLKDRIKAMDDAAKVPA